MPATWSDITPVDGPEAVEAARTKVIKAQAAADKLRVQDAQQAVAQAEAADRQRIADAARKGQVAKPDPAAVAQAREEAAAVERQHEAIQDAIRDADNQLGQAARAHRGAWQAAIAQRRSARRERKRDLIDQLRREYEADAVDHATERWLAEGDGGLDRQRRARTAVLGPLPGSAKRTSNGAPLTIEWTLDALDQSAAEPEPAAQPPAYAQQLRPTPVPV